GDGTWCLGREARAAVASGCLLPKDRYTMNWYGEREAGLFRDVGGVALLEEAYAPFSEWHHWRPGAIGRALSFDEDSSTFAMSTSDPSYEAMALAAGFQCLWQTMRLLNTQCRLKIGTALQRRRHAQ